MNNQRYENISGWMYEVLTSASLPGLYRLLKNDSFLEEAYDRGEENTEETIKDEIQYIKNKYCISDESLKEVYQDDFNAKGYYEQKGTFEEWLEWKVQRGNFSRIHNKYYLEDGDNRIKFN